MPSKPVTLILAEDDDGHATLLERNLERAGFLNTVIRVKDGKEALEFLEGVNAWQGNRPPEGPVLLVLDIRMPRMDGVEVLKYMKGHPQLARTPVVMLTTTDDPREIEKCYRYGCNLYIVKPLEYDDLVEAIRRLGLFLEIGSFPDLSEPLAQIDEDS
jgi:CheY-like chemotaxis protein